MSKAEEYDIKISVIIPVWNPGPGISRCIESLQKQTLKEIEMIFVDDCGTDDSMDKLRAAAADDSRIRILKNEKNIGSGASRNRGIEAANGEYISFVDPDDYVEPDFLEILYTEASKKTIDIVKGTQVREAKDGSRLTRNLNQVIRKGLAQGMPHYLYFTNEHQSAIYRKQLLLTNNIRYGTSKRAQDHVFLLKVSHASKTIELKDEARYYLCERDDSAMHMLDARSLEGCADAVAEQVDYVLNSLPHDENTERFLTSIIAVFLREYERYDCVTDMKEEAGRYLDRLRSELLRIPYCDKLAEHSCSLRILRDYGIGLPMMPYFSPWEELNKPDRYARLMKRWSDFCAAHPDEREACNASMIKIYARIRRNIE